MRLRDGNRKESRGAGQREFYVLLAKRFSGDMDRIVDRLIVFA